MKIIDAHAHFAGDTPEVIDLMKKMDLKIINNAYDGSAHGFPGENARKQRARYAKLSADHPDYFAWVTTFEAAGFQQPDFVEKTIAQLDEDFANGALGVKIWKNIGMDLRKPDGELLMPDDPLFDPIFEHITKRGKTLMVHTGEPWEQFQPIRKGSVHSLYMLRHNVNYYNDPNIAPYERYIQVLDNIMDKHPDMRLVGVHLGSMEHSLEMMSQRLDKYPNFAMDTAGPARTAVLATMDNDDVAAFLTKYADRIMYGTDLLNDQMLSAYSPQEQAQFLAKFDNYYVQVPKYYTTRELVQIKTVPSFGLGLADDVVEKIFATNVFKWFPDLPDSWR